MRKNTGAVKPRDQYVFTDENGNDKYYITIVNVSDYREPDMKYAGEFYDLKGEHLNPHDLLFFGDKLLDRCRRRDN